MTPDEKKWVKRLQKVLNECPSKRLGFYTIGDPEVTIYDRDLAEHAELEDREDFCGLVARMDAELGRVTFPAQVHSTAG